MKKNKEISVTAYIKSAPQEVQNNLKAIRTAIQTSAPGATERTDYFKMPGYSYDNKGYDYDGMFAWFSFKGSRVRLHVRPPVIQDHKKELVGCLTSTGIVTFPENNKIPLKLIKKMVRASVKVMKAKAAKI